MTPVRQREQGRVFYLAFFASGSRTSPRISVAEIAGGVLAVLSHNILVDRLPSLLFFHQQRFFFFYAWSAVQFSGFPSGSIFFFFFLCFFVFAFFFLVLHLPEERKKKMNNLLV